MRRIETHMSSHTFKNVEQRGRNLWKYDGKYYRLFGKGISSNRCWLMCPEMRELVDIDIATGEDVFGENVLVCTDTVGTVSIYHEYIRLAA